MSQEAAGLLQSGTFEAGFEVIVIYVIPLRLHLGPLRAETNGSDQSDWPFPLHRQREGRERNEMGMDGMRRE